MKKGVYIVTGATGGIGGAIARRLVTDGVDTLILPCRNDSKAAAVADSLRAHAPASPTRIETAHLDLASLSSVRTFAAAVDGREIAALINNAGIMPGKVTITTDGIESATATNAVGTALLTELVLPSIVDGGAIVITTSVTRRIVRLRTDWLEHAAAYHGFLRRFKTYGRSKLVLTHYTADLARRVVDRNIRVNCADPGVVDSGIISLGIPSLDRMADMFFRPLISTPDEGANAALSALKSTHTAMIYSPSGRCKPIPDAYTQDPQHDRTIGQLIEAAGL